MSKIIIKRSKSNISDEMLTIFGKKLHLKYLIES